MIIKEEFAFREERKKGVFISFGVVL